MSYSDSTDRTTGDYILLALAFLGFLAASAGVVAASTPVALTGTVLLLLAIVCFALRSSPGE
jgi:uncharacterized membrane protein YbaN (DUF454 family)